MAPEKEAAGTAVAKLRVMKLFFNKLYVPSLFAFLKASKQENICHIVRIQTQVNRLCLCLSQTYRSLVYGNK